MPEMSCLFSAVTREATHALTEEPSCAGRLHHFRECAGLELHGEGLLVIPLTGVARPPWQTSGSGWDFAAEKGWVPPFRQYPWLRGALPPRAVVARWTELALSKPLAWWWWWERGDDLYADASLLLGPEGTTLAIRETSYLSDSGERGQVFRAEADEPEPLGEAPFQIAMTHLGFRSRLQYFVPTGDPSFDWSHFRL